MYIVKTFTNPNRIAPMPENDLVQILPINLIDPPRSPVRTHSDDAQFFALVDSLRAVGQLQPILVTPRGDRFEVVAGHRRIRAASYLRWPTIQARIVVGTEQLLDTQRAHENAFREDVEPEDEGAFFQHLAETHGWGVREIAKEMNRSAYYVQTRLAICTWPADLKDALRHGLIGLAVGEAFSDIADQAERQRLLAYALQSGCNARTARAWADAWAATHTVVDTAAIAAAQQQIAQRWEEPLYPCYSCSTPAPVGRLQVIRLCEDCYNALQHANQQPPTPQRDPRGYSPRGAIPQSQGDNTQSLAGEGNISTNQEPETRTEGPTG